MNIMPTHIWITIKYGRHELFLKYMEDSVVKSIDILLKDNLIRNLKKKLEKNFIDKVQYKFYYK
jgi:hypothetical protein